MANNISFVQFRPTYIQQAYTARFISFNGQAIRKDFGGFN